MKNKFSISSILKNKSVSSILAPIFAIILGLLFGYLIIFVVSPNNSMKVFSVILQGGFSKGLKGVGEVLYKSIPLIFTGLAVAFAFQTGLFDIGASGQYTIGFCASLFTAFYLQDKVTGSSLWIICLLAGMIGGMIWGAIPGLFKALLNVNEVITCIMTNYIGLYLVDMLIRDNPLVYNFNSKWTKVIPENANVPKWGLDKLFAKSSVYGGIIIAIVIAIIINIILKKTKLGYELKACGFNKEAAKYAGINQNSRIILSMIIAGGLAGLAGAMNLQSGVSYTYAPINAMDQTGFNGIAVALLGGNDPIGTVFAAIFFAHIKQGGFYMQTLGVKSEIIDVIVGAIIYFSALSLIIKTYLPTLAKKIEKKKLAKKEKEA